MSDDGHGSSGDHADHDHEAFDAQPATELSPGEPESPLWLPVVGLALFAGVGLWWSMGEEESATEAAATATVSAPAPPPEAVAKRPQRPPRLDVAPHGTAAPKLGPIKGGKLDPQKLLELRRRIQEQREKGNP